MPPKSKAATTSAATRALNLFEENFAKTYGAGSLDRSVAINPYGIISTGSLSLDYALGCGGFVEGRLSEIWGPEGIGKTTLGLYHLAEAQKKNPTQMVAWIDVENKGDKPWALKHGVDLSRLYLFKPNNAEDVADVVKDMIRSGVISAIFVDSIGAMIPEAEKQKDADKAVMAQQAKIVTRMVKIAAAEARQYGVHLLMANQVRANLSYGSDTMSGGGFALRHATTHKLKVKRTGTEPFKAKVGGEDIIVGHEIAIYVERNGVAPAYRTATMVLFNQDTEKYGPVGLDKADEAFTMGLKVHAIKRAGAYYDLPDGHRYQGRPAAVDAIRGDLTLQDQIREIVLSTVASTLLEEEITPEALPEVDTDQTNVDPTVKPTFRTMGSIAADA